MYWERKLDISKVISHKSCFLLGPRQCGKSTLIRRSLPDAYIFDLLDSELYLRLSRSPGYLGEVCVDAERPVVIDEIQKLPSLLDEVHRLIESRGKSFILTSTSARK